MTIALATCRAVLRDGFFLLDGLIFNFMLLNSYLIISQTYLIMKKIFLLFAIFIIACSSPEKKAVRLIKSHLKESLHDWNSYESVKFEGLDSAYTQVFDDSLGKMFRDSTNYYLSEAEKICKESESIKEHLRLAFSHSSIQHYRTLLEENINQAEMYVDSIDFYENKFSEFASNFIPQHRGWMMFHVFRANNAAGHKMIHHIIFTFDKDISKIIDQMDLDENSYLLDK